LDLGSEEWTVSRTSAHPIAQQQIRDDWVFSIISDRPPFGTDDGWEAVHGLQEWLAKGEGDAPAFLVHFSRSYDDEPPRPSDFSSTSPTAPPGDATSPEARRLDYLDNITVGTAIGELVLVGGVSAEVKRRGGISLRRMQKSEWHQQEQIDTLVRLLDASGTPPVP